MEGYSVKIVNSTKPLTAKQRIAVKDFTNAAQLDELTQNGNVIIDVDNLVYCEVHNERAKDKDYKKYVVIDKAGNKFVTGSKSFVTSLMDILREMEGEEEDYQIEVYRMDSKNHKGKQFLTCSII